MHSVRDSASVSESVEYAEIWKRGLAYVIDITISTIVAYLFISIPFYAYLYGLKHYIPIEIIDSISFVAFVMISWLYFTLMESSPFQGTVGKMVFGIAVTDINGDRISFDRATGRYFGKLFFPVIFPIVIISYLRIDIYFRIYLLLPLFSHLIAIINIKNQALHDIFTGCLVVKKKLNLKEIIKGIKLDIKKQGIGSLTVDIFINNSSSFNVIIILMCLIVLPIIKHKGFFLYTIIFIMLWALYSIYSRIYKQYLMQKSLKELFNWSLIAISIIVIAISGLFIIFILFESLSGR